MAEKKSDFVVTDKRKFTAEGELRPEATTEEQQSQKASTHSAAPRHEAPRQPASQQTMPPPPNATEQQVQKDAYRDSGTQFDRSAFRGRTPQDYEMNFERLVASLYMSAMMQLGLMHEEGQPPAADLVGAKQTIDTLSILQDKTKGNLTDQEAHLLQNCLYELRMGFVELTNAFSKQGPPEASAPGGKRG